MTTPRQSPSGPKIGGLISVSAPVTAFLDGVPTPIAYTTEDESSGPLFWTIDPVLGLVITQPGTYLVSTKLGVSVTPTDATMYTGNIDDLDIAISQTAGLGFVAACGIVVVSVAPKTFYSLVTATGVNGDFVENRMIVEKL